MLPRLCLRRNPSDTVAPTHLIHPSLSNDCFRRTCLSPSASATEGDGTAQAGRPPAALKGGS